MASESRPTREIRVRWEGNSSARYDGLTQDIPAKAAVPEDLATAAVGNTVRVAWGKKGSRMWHAVVVDLLEPESSGSESAEEIDSPSSPPQAPAKNRKRKASPSSSLPATKRARSKEETGSKRGKYCL